MRLISRHLYDLRSNWESSGMGYEVRRTAAAFPVLILIGFAVCQFRPDIRELVMEFIYSIFASADIFAEDGGVSAVGLFSNNIQACLMTILYGLVPCIYLPAFSMGLNAMILGVMASYYLSNGYSMALYFAALIPHGVFEFPALILGIACGLFLCRQVTGILLGRKEIPFSQSLLRIAQVYLLLVIPLLALAALTEAYLTPWIITLFS